MSIENLKSRKLKKAFNSLAEAQEIITDTILVLPPNDARRDALACIRGELRAQQTELAWWVSH